MPKVDWEADWRANFPGWWTPGGFWVGPPWLTPPTGATAVIIDPKKAQGTGAHPCTRLCLQLLDRLRGETLSVIDVGCGTGVLGIAAAKIGLGPVTCVDSDPVAIEETLENAARNGVTLMTRLFDLNLEPVPYAELVIADFGSPKHFPFPLDSPKAVITSGYDTTVDVPKIKGLRRTEVAEGDYRGHLHR